MGKVAKIFSPPKPPPMPIYVPPPPPPVVKKVEPKVVEAKQETRGEQSTKKKKAKTKLTGPRGTTRQANVLRPTLGAGAGENKLG
jgi:outer membrane biosynthesis protein TonB